MPFRRTTTLDRAELPDVRIFLQGLLILRPNLKQKGALDILVERWSERHVLSIEVWEDNGGQPNFPLTRILGPLHQPLAITVDKSPQGANAFLPRAKDPRSFSHLLDLTGPDLHYKEKLDLQYYGTQPCFRLTEGTLYTAQLTKPLVRTGGGKKDKKLGPKAAVVGANIYLQGRKLSIKLGGDSLTLPPASASSDPKYVIYIDNSPSELVMPKMAHGHFTHYYNVIGNVPKNKQFDVNVVKTKGTTDVPCMPVGGG